MIVSEAPGLGQSPRSGPRAHAVSRLSRDMETGHLLSLCPLPLSVPHIILEPFYTPQSRAVDFIIFKTAPLIFQGDLKFTITEDNLELLFSCLFVEITGRKR